MYMYMHMHCVYTVPICSIMDRKRIHQSIYIIAVYIPHRGNLAALK